MHYICIAGVGCGSNSGGGGGGHQHDITLVLIVVICVFIVCQTPTLVDHILWTIVSDERRLCGGWHYYYTAFGDLLAILNSSVNFVIYVLTSRRFRRNLVVCRPVDVVGGRMRGGDRSETEELTRGTRIGSRAAVFNLQRGGGGCGDLRATAAAAIDRERRCCRGQVAVADDVDVPVVNAPSIVVVDCSPAADSQV